MSVSTGKGFQSEGNIRYGTMNWKTIFEDWYTFRAKLDFKQYNLLFLWLNYTGMALKLLGQVYLGICSHLLDAVLHRMFPSKWIYHVVISKVLCFCACLLISCLIFWPSWQEYLSEPTSCCLPKQTKNSFDSFLRLCDEIEWCGSVGTRRLRTYFWIFACVFFVCLFVRVCSHRSQWNSRPSVI